MTQLAVTLLFGLSLGAVYALLAAGVTLVYQAARVPNVTVVAIGTAAAVLHGDLMTAGGRAGAGLGWWPALAVSLVMAAGLGLACDVLTRSLREQIVPAFVALLGLTVLILGAVNAIWGSGAKLLPPAWAGPSFQIGEDVLPRSEAATILVAGACAGALFLLSRRTRFGLALRAASFDLEAARMAGMDPAQVGRLAWVISSMLGAVAMTLVLSPVLSNTYETTVYLAFALAAAAVGGFRSLPRAAAAGLVLGLVPTLLEPRAATSGVGGTRNLVAFVLVAGLLLRRRGLLARPALDEAFASAAADSSPGAARRQRATATAAGPAIPRWVGRLGLAAVALVLAVGVPAASTDVALEAWSRGISVFLVCASVVVLSGWTGELPLGQVAFAGFGAYVVGDLGVRAGLPHVAAIPVAVVAVLPCAVLVGVPAFRSRGRLAFGVLSLLWMVVAASLLWGPRARWFTGPAGTLHRPDWMDALSGRPAVSYYLVTLAAAAAVVWFATNLRRSRVGRALAAGRDSDAGARSLGIDPAHYRLVALGFSAAVAALGGVVAAYGPHAVDPARFAVFLSVQYFLYTVIGGARSLAGTAVVVVAFEVLPALRHPTPPTGPASVLVLGALAAAVVLVAPGGLAGVARGLVLRVAPAPPAPKPPVPVGAGLPHLLAGGDLTTGDLTTGDLSIIGPVGAAGARAGPDPASGFDPFASEPYLADDPYVADDPFGEGGPFADGPFAGDPDDPDGSSDPGRGGGNGRRG